MSTLLKAVNYWDEWYFLFTLLSLSVVVLARFLENKGVENRFASLVYEAEAYQNFRQNWDKQLTNSALDVFFLIQLSFFVFFQFFQDRKWVLILFLICGTASLILLKSVAFQLLEWLTKGKANQFYFKYTQNQAARLFGFVLLILNLLFLNHFQFPYKMLFAIGLASFYLWLIIRYLIIGFRYRVYNNLYFFVYLCALEIAPVLLIGKLVLSY